jgi:PAS domain-containing protein
MKENRKASLPSGFHLGHNPRLLKPGQRDPAYYTALWQTILSGKVWHGELTNRRKDGTLYTEEMTIAPVRDPSGAVINFVAIKRDVSERKMAGPSQSMRASKITTEQSGRRLTGAEAIR